MNKLTITDIIDAAKNGGKDNTMEIEVAALGGTITAKKLPLKQVLKMLEGLDQNSVSQQMDFSCKMIYQSCEIFRDHELQDYYHPKKPEDIVLMVLNDDINAVGEITAQLMNFYAVTVDQELED